MKLLENERRLRQELENLVKQNEIKEMEIKGKVNQIEKQTDDLKKKEADFENEVD